MADQTKIEWCDRTFNPWMGCTKVSEGCKHCYAETLMDTRYRKVQWGPQGTRVRTSAEMWKKPLRWNKEAWFQCETCGMRGGHKEFIEHNKTCRADRCNPTRQRVFCASLADVFEDRPELVEWRFRLWDMVETTRENLDWLILTKRPENILRMVPQQWLEQGGNVFPENIWLGTTVENQKAADERIPALVNVPARVRFLSVEPMLENIELGLLGTTADWKMAGDKIHWVICGGESGQGCRPMNVEWALGLRYQCAAAGVPFFMKQMGGHPDKRDRMSDLPALLQVREWPV